MRHRTKHTRRTCCEDFWGCHAGEMPSEIPEFIYDFSKHNPTPLCLLEFCLSNFFVSCSSLREVTDSVELRYVPIYITDQVVFLCFFCKRYIQLQIQMSYSYSSDLPLKLQQTRQTNRKQKETIKNRFLVMIKHCLGNLQINSTGTPE